MKPTLLMAATAALAGCAGPEITIRHVLPADLPVPAELPLAAGEFTAVAGEQAYADFAAGELAKRIAAAGRDGSAGGSISARVWVHTDESKGKRAIRRYNPQQRATETVDVSTLRRTARVRVDFALAGPDGQPLAPAETRGQYDSSDDPRARGPLGLGRADAPQFVPSAQTIVQELLTGCVDIFWHMIEPRVVSATVRLRPSAGRHGRTGQQAAADRDFARAVEAFSSAVAADPRNTDLAFNLAVCLEAAGRLKVALLTYKDVLARRPKGFPEAAAAVTRIQRVQQRRGG